MPYIRNAWSLSAFAAVLLAASHPAQAQDAVADFYKGKTINMIIGLSAGGGYDIFARLVARHMVKYIPGKPDQVPRNMTGAGGLLAANYMYNVAPKDGTHIGAPQRGVPFEPLSSGHESKAQFDPLKFQWIGSANAETSIAVAWHTTGIKTYQDLMTKEIIMGGTGAGTESVVLPYVLANVLGFKIKVIAGYPGGSEVDLAMERGEVGGRGTMSWTSFKARQMHWLTENKVSILYQQSMEKHPDLPNVPLALDLAKNEADRQLLEVMMVPLLFGRPYMVPPETPRDRVDALRKAFDATMIDKDFIADAEKAKLEVEPVSGVKMEELLKKAYATPKPILDRLAEVSKFQPGLKLIDGAKP